MLKNGVLYRRHHGFLNLLLAAALAACQNSSAPNQLDTTENQSQKLQTIPAPKKPTLDTPFKIQSAMHSSILSAYFSQRQSVACNAAYNFAAELACYHSGNNYFSVYDCEANTCTWHCGNSSSGPALSNYACCAKEHEILIETSPGQSSCHLCPSSVAGFLPEENLCHTSFDFNIELPPDVPYVNGFPVISPRDQNDIFDTLSFSVGLSQAVAPYSTWRVRATNLAVGSSSDYTAQGSQTFIWTAWVNNECLPDGPYQASLGWPSQLENVPLFFEELDEEQEVNIYIEPLPEPNQHEFWIDNTPPVLQNVLIQESFESDTFGTQISLVVVEPIVNEVWSNLDTNAIKMFIDHVPLHSFPNIGETNFWLLSPVPQNQISIQSLGERTAQVSLTLPYHLADHLVEIEVADRAANQARYTIYPTGGNL